VPAVPRGGAPIFSTPTSQVSTAKKMAQLKVKVKHGQALVTHHASTVKHSIVFGKSHPVGIHAKIKAGANR
jgi:hypothetical protein